MLEGTDAAATAENLIASGAAQLGGPVATLWAHKQVRLRTPDGMQRTRFTVRDGVEEP